MAEIKITKKTKWWPWIILILVLLAVLIYFMMTSNRMDEMNKTTDITSEAVELISEQTDFADSDYSKADLEVAEYTSFINDTNRLGSDFDYTKDALVQLSNAVRQTAIKHNLNIDGRVEKVKIDSEQIQKDVDSVGLAKKIKIVGGDISAVIGQLEKKNFPDMANASEKIERAVASIIPTQRIDEQKEPIIAFFKSCGDALKEMKHETEKK